MQFHPYAETFPLLTGAAYDEFKADIASTKGPLEPARYRLNGQDKEGLDGRNRVNACRDLGIECPMLLVEIAEADVVAFINSLNIHRRHLTPEQQQERRQKRVERVAAARAAGMSLRDIAEQEGVSVSQIQRDLENPTVPGGTVEPESGKTQGKDGKRRSASTRKLCQPCLLRQVVGEPKIAKCPECKELNKKKKKEKPPAVPEAILDSLKSPVPKDLEEVFTHATEFRAMMREIGAIRTAADKLGKTPAGGWIDHQDLDRVLKQAQMHLRFALPYTECPKCRRKKDKKCTACKGTNWINETVYGSASSDEDKAWLKGRA